MLQLASWYMDRHAKLRKKPSSIAMDQRLLDKVILPGLGGLKVAGIGPEHIQGLHLEQRSYPVRANRVLALLSKMFNLAETWGLRPEGSNPVAGIERHPEKGRQWAASAEDYVRLWRALEDCQTEGKVLPTLPLAIKLLMLLGCHKKEILSLKWSQVSLADGHIRFQATRERSRMMALPRPAMEALRSAPRLEDNPYVCWGKKQGSHLVGVNRFFKRLAERAGLTGGLRIQDLRHPPASGDDWYNMV